MYLIGVSVSRSPFDQKSHASGEKQQCQTGKSLPPRQASWGETGATTVVNPAVRLVEVGERGGRAESGGRGGGGQAEPRLPPLAGKGRGAKGWGC